MKKEFEALISDKNKELLNSMAKRQNELRQEASDLAEKLAEMGKSQPNGSATAITKNGIGTTVYEISSKEFE